jgi:hypothetical protein
MSRLPFPLVVDQAARPDRTGVRGRTALPIAVDTPFGGDIASPHYRAGARLASPLGRLLRNRARTDDGRERTVYAVSSSERVAIRLVGLARVDAAEMEQLAVDLAAAAKEEPGTVGYAWSRAPDSTHWTIDEEYSDEAALTAHIQHLVDSGLLRRMGKAFRIEKLVVLSGDPESVGRHLGLTPTLDED